MGKQVWTGRVPPSFVRANNIWYAACIVLAVCCACAYFKVF